VNCICSQDGREEDDTSTPVPLVGTGAGRSSMSGGPGQSSTAQRSALHRAWRFVDERYMKPWFGGRSRMWEAVRHSEELTADGVGAQDGMGGDDYGGDEPIRYALFERMNTASHFHGPSSARGQTPRQAVDLQLQAFGSNPLAQRLDVNAAMFDTAPPERAPQQSVNRRELGRTGSSRAGAGGSATGSNTAAPSSGSARGASSSAGGAGSNRAASSSPMLLGDPDSNALLGPQRGLSDGI